MVQAVRRYRGEFQVLLSLGLCHTFDSLHIQNFVAINVED